MGGWMDGWMACAWVFPFPRQSTHPARIPSCTLNTNTQTNTIPCQAASAVDRHRPGDAGPAGEAVPGAVGQPPGPLHQEECVAACVCPVALPSFLFLFCVAPLLVLRRTDLPISPPTSPPAIYHSLHRTAAEWTEEEDLLLIDAHRRHGNRWADIARMIPGRTENAVKNRCVRACVRAS